MRFRLCSTRLQAGILWNLMCPDRVGALQEPPKFDGQLIGGVRRGESLNQM